MARFSKKDFVKQDMEIAYTVLESEGKEPDMRKIQEDVHADWEIIERSLALPQEEREKISTAVWSHIKMFRDQLESFFPCTILDRKNDYYFLTETINHCIALNRDAMDDSTLAKLARVKRSIARDVILPLLDKQVPLQKLLVDHKVNALIDGNANKNLEEIIEIVLSYLLKNVLGHKIENISFFLVNEHNQYEQIDSLTEISPGSVSGPMPRRDFNKGREHIEMLGEKDHIHGNRLITDYPNNRLYLELNIKGLDLGVFQLDMKPGENLDPSELEYLLQTASRLDTKIDEAMRSKRLALIAEKAHRMLDEHSAEDDFEEGIAKFMVFVCRYSTAFEAEVAFDIFGDGEDFFATKYNDNGEVTEVEKDENIKAKVKIPSANLKTDDKHVLMTDIIEGADRKPGEIIGKVYFRTNKDTDELRNEDRTLLSFCADILHHHILAWRKNLQLRIEGVDHQIARTILRGGVKDTVKEIITALYTDISGFTHICELVEDVMRDYPETMEDVETLKAIVSVFLNLVQKTGQSYGGVWDKAAGDQGLLEYGIPIDKDGLDPLGDSSPDRHPEYFALNALKASLLIRHKLGTVTEKLREHLIRIACKKYSCETPPEELAPEQQNQLLEQLKDETGLTPKISTTTSVYTGTSGYVKLLLGAASDWTGIGNTMNSGARVQGSSGRMEIRVPLLTRDLVLPLIMADKSIPIDRKGEKESWSEFVRNRLGMNPDQVTVEFAESYESHKNRSGKNAVFTLIIKERNPEIDMIKRKSIVPAEKLLQFEGTEFAIEHRAESDGKTQQFFLRTVRDDAGKPTRFCAIIPQEAIEEVVPKFTSPRALAIRQQNGTVDSLMVQDGKFKEFIWKSIEENQDEQLTALAAYMKKSKEQVILKNELVPGGCYMLATQEPAESKAYEMLTLIKNNYIFKVRVSTGKIHEGPGPIMKDLEVLYDFQSYYDIIKGKISPDKPVVFVHKGHFYKIMPADAEAYILPIVTRPSFTRNHPENEPHSLSNPPPFSLMPPVPVAAQKKPPKIWQKIQEQLAEKKKNSLDPGESSEPDKKN